MRRAVLAGFVLFAAGLALALAAGPAAVERRFNRVQAGPARPVSAAVAALHARLAIADLHADSLLWGRDLLARGERGHVDVPRLGEGNVALQAFTVVTKVPRGLNIASNTDGTDNVLPLALLQRWPRRTWTSLLARAVHQAERLHRFADRSGGRLVVVRDRASLARHLAGRKPGGPTAALLGLEGAHALEGDLAHLDVLYEAGFRMIAPVHFFDTEWAGSAHGVEKGGLTPEGRALVARLEERRMLLDLAHASPRAIDDALSLARRPVIVSHTGVKGTCDNARNLSDAHLRGIANTGGVIGIGFWDTAVCGTTARDVARAIRYAVAVAGVRHVALGSDWDGAVTVPFDAARLAELTGALVEVGLSEDEIALVMGGNTLRVLGDTLP